MKRIAGIVVLVAFRLAAAEPEYNAAGQLVKPENYREWVFLSAGLGMTYGAPAAQARPNPPFDNVFVEPAAYRKFVETGGWPDKTIFALEIRESVSKGSINTAGQYQTGVIAVEFAVKDVARFPGEWGYFAFRPSVTSAAVLPQTASCYACHSQNGAVENTFVQFYPTLLEIARAKGTLRPSYLKSVDASH
jgi:hypothetical protein